MTRNFPIRRHIAGPAPGRLQVIAEGVEAAEQRDLLAGKDCDAFQGCLFGHPVALAAQAGL